MQPDEKETPAAPDAPADETPTTGSPDSSQEALQDDDYVPFDPFAPEIFNRRFLRR